MNDSRPRVTPETTQQPPADEGEQLDQLRRLLWGDELETRRNSPPLQSRDISPVLAEAIADSQQQSPKLSHAAVPTVEAAIRQSVELDSNILSDALFPVIGPATRKSVAAALRNLTQSLNQGLEHSLSPQSLGWRIEAARTGRSFAEVVLLRTLIYQVEQVLLIHRETGLLLQQVMAETASGQDPDLVSAMLTAIQDFVKDSFHVQPGGSLDTLEFGELNIWIEEGPQAVLACVIRGNAPQELREQLQERLEKVHATFAPLLQSFDGDTEALAGSRLYLEDCLRSQFKGKNRQHGNSNDAGNKGSSTASKRLLSLGLCLFVGLSTWFIHGYWTQHRWQAYIEALNQYPGIVVLDSHQRRGSYYVSGLRDPLAINPNPLLMEYTNLQPEDVAFHWEPYLSLEPEIVQQRLQLWLAPPDSVTLTLEVDDVVRVTGIAPQVWIDSAQVLTQTQGGWVMIRHWDFSQLRSSQESAS